MARILNTETKVLAVTEDIAVGLREEGRKKGEDDNNIDQLFTLSSITHSSKHEVSHICKVWVGKLDYVWLGEVKLY